MQERPKTETRHGAASEAAAPAKPPRLKAKTVEFASKKQLQFESPLPLRRSRAATATMTMKTTATATTATTTEATTSKLRQGKTTKRTAPPPVAAADAQADVAATTIVSATANVTATAAATRTRTTAIKTRLAVGCSSLMYACQHGDIVQVLAQMRAKVGAQSLELSGRQGESKMPWGLTHS